MPYIVKHGALYLGPRGSWYADAKKARVFTQAGHAKNALSPRSGGRYLDATRKVHEVEICRVELHTVAIEHWRVA